MQLEPYTDADLALTMALERDPQVMAELGGPRSRSEVAEVHRKRLQLDDDLDWWLKIVPEPGGPAVGTIGVWSTEHDGASIHEVGWTVLPEFQGRGFASAALALLLDRARAHGRIAAVHAFPGVTNAPSNALCRKYGFELLGQIDVTFAARPLRCNHWALELAT